MTVGFARFSLVLFVALDLTGATGAVSVRVLPDRTVAEVPRTIYGTGMEDVNHEIYGGLDAQRLYNESFEEEVETFGDGVAVATTNDVHLGSRALRLVPNGGCAAAVNRGLNRWGVPCRAGRRMVGWVHVRGRVDRLEVALQSADGTQTYAMSTLETSEGKVWKKRPFALLPTMTDAKGRFVVKACGRGEVVIDDVYLKDEPTDCFGEMGCREDIVDGLRREGLTFLRWGGSMVNAPEYLLKNMKGDRRPYAGFWFRTSSMGFCVPEFVKMSEALGLPCAFSIHAYDSTEDAVKFATALKDVRVPLYVEIGNEECSGYTPAAGRPTSAQVRLYGAAVRRLVPAMRAANPNLRFVSAMHWFDDRIPLMEEAFELTDGYCDYWDIHVLAGALDAGAGVRRSLGLFRDLIARKNPKSRMKAAIFEENGKDHGLRRALAHARILEAVREQGDFLLTSCPANALQPYRQNDNGWDQGQVFFTTDKVWLQPCGWAQRMASDAHRDILVESSVAGGALTVSATRDREGRSVVLHVVNSEATPQAVDIDLCGSKMLLKKVTTLTASQLDADNPPEDPDRVSPKDVTEAFRAKPEIPAYSYTVIEFVRDGWIRRCESAAELGRPLPKWTHGELDLHFISTGVGENMFYILPDGTTWLNDCGDYCCDRTMVRPRPSDERLGGEWVARYVARLIDAKRIDYMTISHWHTDHAGDPKQRSVNAKDGRKVCGAALVAEYFDFDRYLDFEYPATNLYGTADRSMEMTRAYVDVARRERGLEAEPFRVGALDQIALRHDPKGEFASLFHVRNLCANAAVWTGEGEGVRDLAGPSRSGKPVTVNQNTLSMGVRISYGPFSFYTGGDVSKRIGGIDCEAAVAQACGPVTVAKTNHHGTPDTMGRDVVAALRPAAWVSCIWHKAQINDTNMRWMSSRELYPGDRVLFPTAVPEQSRKTTEGCAWWRDVAPAGHVVVRVAPGGASYRIFVLDDTDESMRVKAVYEGRL